MTLSSTSTSSASTSPRSLSPSPSLSCWSDSSDDAVAPESGRCGVPATFAAARRPQPALAQVFPVPLAITVPHQAVAAAAAREHIAGMRLRFVQQAHLVGMVLFPALPSACQLAILVGSAVAQYQGIGRGPVTASVLLMGALLAASEGVARVCYPAGAAPAMPADAPHALNVGPHALYLLSLVLHVMAESVIAAHAGADLRAARRAYPDLDVPRPDVRPPHAPGPGAFVPDVAAPDVPALAAEPGA